MRLDQAYSPFHVDRRRAERIAIALPCRVALGDGSAFLAETTCVSADGAALACAAPVVEGEIVSALIGQIGLVRGRVARFLEDGFAIAFDRDGRPDRVAALIWLEQRLDGARAELRRHERHLPPPAAATLALDGEAAEAVVVRDLSFGGARLETAARPPIGTRARLGAMPAQVVRHTADGIAIAFTGA
ncbi:PilZ domain-containing protein [Salinarimonas sp.]|uniref:PilZ domain-containing protein n=1 Tax=Salinarimonas sp. TaxID=2766526 RepID=UPI0032D96A2F